MGVTGNGGSVVVLGAVAEAERPFLVAVAPKRGPASHPASSVAPMVMPRAT